MQNNKMQYALIQAIKGAFLLLLAILFAGCSNEKSTMTKEDRIFAEQWNKWVQEHPKEINDLRTRAIADNMTKEEISREMIGFMVRFSTEANLEIPQRFIDELKQAEVKPKKIDNVVSEVISRTFGNLFSFTTVIGVILFGLVYFLRFAPASLTMIGAKDSEGGGLAARGCGAVILMWLGEAFAVFYLVVAISPKVLGFSDSAHWGLPFAALFGSFGTTLKYLIMGLVMSLIGTFVPIVGRFQIFIYTMMSVVFYRVGYKMARPEGYRIGNDAYKDYFPEFGVSTMIIFTCIILSFVSIFIGSFLTKNQYDPEPEKRVQGFEAIGALIFAIIPIYMYGAWFSLKMQ